MKHVLLLTLALFITGCSSATSEYYQSVEKAAQANAAAAQAKFAALAQIANAGDGQAASAAVMALALTQTPTINPIPQQSQAIQWASILAAPVSNLGMMWLQNDTTKAMAQYTRDVDLARITADADTQQAMYGAFTTMNNVDYSGFINGMVDLGTAGITGVENVGIGGINATSTVGTNGINAVGGVAEVGFGAVVDVAQDNNDFVTGIVNQYTATVNNFVDNPLTNTTNTQTTIVCAPDATGVIVCQ